MAAEKIRHHKVLGLSSPVLLSFIAVCLTWCGCCGRFDSTVKKNDDEARAWLTESWSGRYDWIELPAWRDVVDSKTQQAESLLRDAAFVQIKWEQASALIGQASFPVIKRTPFLLRGVGDAQGRFPLELFVRPNGEVWVGGGANSKCPVARLRKAVVAWLDKAPSKVYVTFAVNSD